MKNWPHDIQNGNGGEVRVIDTFFVSAAGTETMVSVAGRGSPNYKGVAMAIDVA